MSDYGAPHDGHRATTARRRARAATLRPSVSSPVRGALTVLHVVAPAPVGGLESVVRLLTSGQSAAGHRVAVACVLDGGTASHPFVEALRDTGVRVHAIRVNGRRYGDERRSVRELCVRIGPQIVHTHGYRPDVVDSGVARDLSIAAVTTVHGFTGNGWRNRLYEWLQVRTFRRFDAVVAVSSPLADVLASRGIGRDRLHVVPNAYERTTPPLARADARHALGIPLDARVIGWVGRLSREKGPDVLLAALAAAKFPENTIAVFLGDGRERAALGERARQLGAEGRVRFLGAVANAERMFGAFDVLALSSRTEGTPMVLFEAMSARVPIVATSVGGVPDVVGSDTALLVPPDDPAALARSLRDVLDRPDAAARRAERGVDRLARTYDVASWVARHDQLYRQLLHHR